MNDDVIDFLMWHSEEYEEWLDEIERINNDSRQDK
jgi:hypothetical protein